MLTELHVEHLGVIERLDLVLGPGLTAVTGETGAGKTMLVEALELLVGGRADASIVRPGAPEVRVDGRFVELVGTAEPTSWCSAASCRRTVGRGPTSTVGRRRSLRSAEVAAPIVDLHGQHAHQSLPRTGHAARRARPFGGVDLAPLRAARARLTELDAELAALGGDLRSRAREIDLLRFQVDELVAAGLDDPDEERELDALEDQLADAVGHRDAGAVAHGALVDDGGSRDALAAAVGALGWPSPVRRRRADGCAPCSPSSTTSSPISAGSSTASRRIHSGWQATRARRQQLRDLCRKYGDDRRRPAGLPRRSSPPARRARGLRPAGRRARRARRAAALGEERAAAEAVGRARRAAAPALAAAVTARLGELAMAHAEIAVSVGDHDDDHPGDRVQFLLAANPGSPMLPLTKVASGGELARAMLALRLVLLGVDGDVERTLVFDEVDAGIGGTAAGAVARALAEVAQRHQVLVVTHLAQVAALATAQIVVRKHVVGGETTTTVGRVEGDDRVAELARMLSGAEGGAAAHQHAAELLRER